MLFVFLISTADIRYPELIKDTREPGLCHGGFQYRSKTYWSGDDFVQITTFSSLHFLSTMGIAGLPWGLTQEQVHIYHPALQDHDRVMSFEGGGFENIVHCLKRIWHFGIISPVGFIGNELIASSSKPAFPGFEALGLWGEGREWGRRPPAGYLNAGQNYVFPKILDIFQWIRLTSLAFVLLSC